MMEISKTYNQQLPSRIPRQKSPAFSVYVASLLPKSHFHGPQGKKALQSFAPVDTQGTHENMEHEIYVHRMRLHEKQSCDTISTEKLV